jgi:hypothetical protein
MKLIIFFTFILLETSSTKSQSFKNSIVSNDENESNKEIEQFNKTTNGRVNVFIFTRERYKRVDLLAFYTLLRARVKSLFHHKTFYVVNARSSKDAAAKVERILHKKRKLINNLWFDSHGHYGNRYSSFRVGTDQFYYKNINEASSIKYLQVLACYTGADFYFPATDSTPVTRMNGDSLMIGLGDIFDQSTIYASESWVMAKPGIFTNKFGFAGYPLQRRFKDSVYAPVWQRIGKWRQYSKKKGEIKSIPTIALDRRGNIHTRYREYNSFYKSRKSIAKALKKLKPALAKF